MNTDIDITLHGPLHGPDSRGPGSDTTIEVTMPGMDLEDVTCLITGADGENPDDCTTHEHEQIIRTLNFTFTYEGVIVDGYVGDSEVDTFARTYHEFYDEFILGANPNF